jgi:hypothetical protein
MKRFAVAKPMPLLPPVITATLPSSALIFFSFDYLSFTIFFQITCFARFSVSVPLAFGGSQITRPLANRELGFIVIINDVAVLTATPCIYKVRTKKILMEAGCGSCRTRIAVGTRSKQPTRARPAQILSLS